MSFENEVYTVQIARVYYFHLIVELVVLVLECAITVPTLNTEGGDFKNNVCNGHLCSLRVHFFGYVYPVFFHKNISF